jgi:hypothetical protein
MKKLAFAAVTERPDIEAQAIIRIEEGASLREIAEWLSTETKTEWSKFLCCRWFKQTPEREKAYYAARRTAAMAIAEEVIEIADAATPETVGVAKLRIDARKWDLTQRDPSKFGERVHVTGHVNHAHDHRHLVITPDMLAAAQAERARLDGVVRLN